MGTDLVKFKELMGKFKLLYREEEEDVFGEYNIDFCRYIDMGNLIVWVLVRFSGKDEFDKYVFSVEVSIWYLTNNYYVEPS